MAIPRRHKRIDRKALGRHHFTASSVIDVHELCKICIFHFNYTHVKKAKQMFIFLVYQEIVHRMHL